MNFGSIIHDVLRHKYKGCEYICAETYDSLQWLDQKIPKPSLEQLVADIEEYKLNRDKYNYHFLRAKEYPSNELKLEALWQASAYGDNSMIIELKKHIEIVDAKYPTGD